MIEYYSILFIRVLSLGQPGAREARLELQQVLLRQRRPQPTLAGVRGGVPHPADVRSVDGGSARGSFSAAASTLKFTQKNGCVRGSEHLQGARSSGFIRPSGIMSY